MFCFSGHSNRNAVSLVQSSDTEKTIGTIVEPLHGSYISGAHIFKLNKNLEESINGYYLVTSGEDGNIIISNVQISKKTHKINQVLKIQQKNSKKHPLKALSVVEQDSFMYIFSGGAKEHLQCHKVKKSDDLECLEIAVKDVDNNTKKSFQ